MQSTNEESKMQSTNEESLIQAETDARVRAVRAKNVEEVLAKYAPDIITFDLVTPLRNTNSVAVRKRLSDWFASFKTTIDYEISDLNIAVAGDVAFDHHLTKVHGVNQSGQVIDMWFRETIGYRKIHGSWKITHQHSSVPMDMENGKARLDLKP